MSPRTLTAPPTDKGMWRRLLARAHPDHGGDDGLFIWANALREHVAGDALEPPREAPRCAPTREDNRDRVQFDPQLGYVDDFVDLIHRALSIGRRVEEPYAGLLMLLIDCGAADQPE